MQNRGTAILLSIISILTVIVTLVGLTFAFFTASMSGSNGTVSVTSEANIGNIQFDGGSDFVAGSNIEPGWSESRNITLTIPAGKAQEIYLMLDYTNNMPELQYKFILTNIMIGTTNSGTSSPYVTNDFSDNGASITSTGTDFITLDSSNTSQSVILTQVNTSTYAGTITLTYQYTMKLPETNIEQNQNQGKLFTGTLYGLLEDETIYYNNSNPNGTTTEPTAS